MLIYALSNSGTHPTKSPINTNSAAPLKSVYLIVASRDFSYSFCFALSSNFNL